MKKYFFIVTAAFLFAAGCKKDSVAVSGIITPSKLLAGDTAKTWIDFYRSGTRGNNSQYVINTPCFTDDNWVFKASGYFEWNEGGSKCNAADPYVYNSGNWKLSSDNKYIEFTNVAGSPGIKSSFKFEIVELTNNKLSVKIAAPDLYVSTTAIEEDHLLIAK